MANFAIIHARHAEEFEYVIIDITEIIPESYRNACSFLTDDIELYLPNEYELFLKSPARKKIIWLVPSQLELLENESFDFFCNTESFAEMPPYVAQNYWIEVERLLKIDSFAFLVNRVSRFTGESHDCYSEMSSPFKLQSNRLKPVSVSVDKFRSKIPKFTDRPNLVSVYKSLQDKC